MKTSAFYLNQLEQAKTYDVPGDLIARLKECYEFAATIELAHKQTNDSDAMTIITEAVKEMRE